MKCPFVSAGGLGHGRASYRFLIDSAIFYVFMDGHGFLSFRSLSSTSLEPRYIRHTSKKDVSDVGCTSQATKGGLTCQ